MKPPTWFIFYLFNWNNKCSNPSILHFVHHIILLSFLNYLQSILRSVSVWLSELHEPCFGSFWCNSTFSFQETGGWQISQRWSKNVTVKMRTIHRVVNSAWLVESEVKPVVTIHAGHHTDAGREQCWQNDTNEGHYLNMTQITSLYIEKCVTDRQAILQPNIKFSLVFNSGRKTLYSEINSPSGYTKTLVTLVTRYDPLQRLKHFEISCHEKPAKKKVAWCSWTHSGKWHLPPFCDLRASTWEVRAETSFSLFNSFSIVSEERQNSVNKCCLTDAGSWANKVHAAGQTLC